MSDVERLEAELEVAKLAEEYREVRDRVQAQDVPDRTKEDLDKMHELSKALQDANVAFKQKFPPPAPAEGDAVATPEAISGGVTVLGDGGDEA